jgi:hypothetical protein
MEKTQLFNINRGSDRSEDISCMENLELKSKPKYLSDLHSSYSVISHVNTWSLASPLTYDIANSMESNDYRALLSDWDMSSDDILEAVHNVVSAQSPKFQREFYLQMLKKIMENKSFEQSAIEE